MRYLAELHHKVKQREEALPREPIPSFRLPQLPQPHTQPKSPTPPQYHASPRVPDHRLYAALGLGDTMPDAPLPDAPSAPTSPDAPPAPTSPDAPPAPTSPDSAPTEAQTCNYTAADLAENQEIQLTPEIRALAQKLGFSPVKTYQYVLNEIQFEPYYGSLKGAVGTLVAKSGGPTDQASLLIALLRASNIPARYVKGTIEVDDERAQRWVGAKSYYMAAWIFGLGNNPAYYYVTSDGTANGTQLGIQISHVWVEACVPYGNYRGTKVDKTGYRWIPLDPSFKDKSYQAGITTNVNFDYSGYLATRTGTLPHEKYLEQVESYIKTQAPNFANNTLQDVGYIGTQVPRTLDILPASLPYYVNSFDAWGPGLTAETAEVPDTHRYKLSVTVKNGATTMATTTLSYPSLALQRVTLSYKPATSGDQSIWNSWSGDLKNLPAGIVNVVPVIKVDGLDQVVGSTSTTLGQWNTLIMKLTLADTQFAHPWCPGDDGGTDPDIHCVNKIVETNLTAGEYDALGSYAFQASDRLLTERAAKLLHSVRNSPAPTTPLPYANDETTGEFLHLALLKYMRYISDAGERIGEM